MFVCSKLFVCSAPSVVAQLSLWSAFDVVESNPKHTSHKAEIKQYRVVYLLPVTASPQFPVSASHLSVSKFSEMSLL